MVLVIIRSKPPTQYCCRDRLICIDWLAQFQLQLNEKPMADHQSIRKCQVSLNPIIKIHERSDKRGVGEVDLGRLLHIYREDA